MHEIRDVTNEVVSHLFIEIGSNRDINHHVLLVAATNQIDLVEAGILCHIVRQIEIPVPGPRDRSLF